MRGFNGLRLLSRCRCFWHLITLLHPLPHLFHKIFQILILGFDRLLLWFRCGPHLFQRHFLSRLLVRRNRPLYGCGRNRCWLLDLIGTLRLPQCLYRRHLLRRFFRRNHLFLRFIQRHFRNQFPAGQSVLRHPLQQIIDQVLVTEPQLHLSRMHIHIQHLPIHVNSQAHKGIPMLHHKGFITIFDALCNDLTLDIATIYKIIFIIPVASGNLRFSKEASHMKRSFLPVYFNQAHGHISSIEMIDHIF